MKDRSNNINNKTIISTLLSLPVLLSMGCTNLNDKSKTEYVETSNKQAQSCQFSANDTMWVNRTIAAWHYSNKTIAMVSQVPVSDVLFFDAHCQQVSGNALTQINDVTWTSELHGGKVQLPNGDEIPPVVSSFASSSEEEGTFFVMSVPSIWQEGGVKNAMGLDKFMVPVMLHEAMHVVQSATYGKQIDMLTDKHNLPESFYDDSVQLIFEDNRDFSSSVQIEVELLMQAALAPTDAETRRLATKARDMINLRYDTWLTGEFEKYRDIDGVWLTMEGSGQWLGYRWLAEVNGGNVTKAEAIELFGLRGKWWSQKLGFALFMVIDRLSDNWKNEAFGSGNKGVLSLLDDALLAS